MGCWNCGFERCVCERSLRPIKAEVIDKKYDGSCPYYGVDAPNKCTTPDACEWCS